MSQGGQKGWLSLSPTLRGVIGALLGTAGVLVVTKLILPGTERGVGTPLAIIFLGMVLGLLNGLITSGLILIYRTARVINFAQAAMGSVGGIFTYNLIVLNNWNYFLAFFGGLIVAVLVGLAVELLVVRRFFDSPRLVLTVVTIGLGPLFGFMSGFVTGLPIFNSADRSIRETLGSEGFNLPFPDFTFRVGEFPLGFGFGHVFAIVLSVIVFVMVTWFLKYTKTGVSVRAVSENAERAQLVGIDAKGLSTLVWTIATFISTVGVLLTMTINRTGPATGTAVRVLLPALAAAIIGRMKSLPVGVAAAVGITIVQQGIIWSFRDLQGLFDAFLMVVILLALLVQRDELQRSEERESTSWEATEEIRPIPKEMLAVRGIRVWRMVLSVLGLLVAFVIFPLAATVGQLNTGGFVAIVGIVLLSLVILTGWTMQVSLGQFALVAIAAILAGAFTRKMGMSFWLTIPLVSLLTAAFAVLIGLPALRIKGLFLGVTTLAFALAVQGVMFSKDLFGWLLPDQVVRPTLFFFNFEDERSMYYLCLVFLVVALLIVGSLRRTRPGRIMIALRENEANVQSFGVPLVQTKLVAFALSGAMCGLAGVLLAHHQRAVTAQSFDVQESLNVFMTVVIAGASSPSGALIGAVYLAITRLFAGNPIVGFLSQGGALVLILYMAPGGLASILYGLRDSVLTIVAQRRRILVPSLFKDFDPSVLEAHVAPLAVPLPNAGLAAVDAGIRYRIVSRLHGLVEETKQIGRRTGAEDKALRAASATAGGDADG